jgi:hypothetical protein
MDEPKYCFVQFKLTYTTVFGEEVRVVGNIPELGKKKINFRLLGCKEKRKNGYESIGFSCVENKGKHQG